MTKDTMSVKEYTEAQYIELSEQDHQTAFIAWCDDNPENLPGLELMYNIPNGGGGRIRGAQLKRTGLRAGMPDLCLPAVGWHLGDVEFYTLYIEMKKVGKYATTEQKAKHAELRALGHAVEICQGSEAAKAVVRRYYAGTLEDTT